MWKKFSLLFGIILVIVWVYIIGIGKIISTLFSANPVFVFLAFLVYPFTLLSIFLKQKVLFSELHKFRLSFLLKKTLIAWGFGMVVPGKIGDFSLAVFLKKQLVYGKSLAALIIDKLTSLFSALLFSIITFFILFNVEALLSVIASIVFLAIIIYAFVFLELPRRLIRDFILGKHKEKLAGFNLTIKFFIKEKPMALLSNFLLANIRMVLITLAHLLLFLSIGFTVDFLLLFLVLNTAMIISFIPLTPAGIGLRQLGFVGLLALFSVPLEISTSVALLALVLDYLYAFGIFLFSFIQKKQSKIVL